MCDVFILIIALFHTDLGDVICKSNKSEQE